jgi:hypothetical protein
LAEVIDPQHVGMAQIAGEDDLTAESLEDLGVVGELGSKNLDRYRCSKKAV